MIFFITRSAMYENVLRACNVITQGEADERPCLLNKFKLATLHY